MSDSISEQMLTNRMKQEIREPAANAQDIFRTEVQKFITELGLGENTENSPLSPSGLAVVEKIDDTTRSFYSETGYKQEKALFYDFIGPHEHDPIQILNMPRDELLTSTDSERAPSNLPGRIALRSLVENQTNSQPAQDLFTLEFLGEIPERDLRFANQEFDRVTPGIKRNTLNTIEIRTPGKTTHEITAQLQKALSFMKPYIHQQDAMSTEA